MLSAPPQAISDVEALMREIAADQGGVLTDLICEHLATGGKRLRARLALNALEGFGADVGAGVPWAAACELLHNATLIHDDIQDGDTLRRGQATLWARHGVSQAINAGDLLFVLPFAAVCRVRASVECRLALVALVARHAAAIIQGQGQELQLTAAHDLDRQKYLATVRGKTSGLFALPVVGAALIAGRSETARLEAAFAELGLMFQMQDDVLDCYGDKGRGRPGNDIAEGKVSVLAVAHAALHPDDCAWLVEVLARPRAATRDADIQQVIERFRQGGALAAVLNELEVRRHAVRETLVEDPSVLQLFDAAVAAALEPLRQALVEHVIPPAPTG